MKKILFIVLMSALICSASDRLDYTVEEVNTILADAEAGTGSTNIGYDAECMIIQPDGYIQYYDELIDCTNDFTDGCTLKILKPIVTTNYHLFYGNDVVFDGGGVPIEVTWDERPGNFGALMFGGTNWFIHDVHLHHITTTNYPTGVNSYGMTLSGVVTGLVQDCYLQQDTYHTVTNVAGTPKTLVAVGPSECLTIRGGALGAYAADPSNTLPCTIFVNHNRTNNAIFQDVAFYNNENALQPLMGDGDALIDGITFQNCKYNGEDFLSNSGVSIYQISTMTTNDVRSYAWPGTADLFVESDTTTNQYFNDVAGTRHIVEFPEVVSSKKYLTLDNHYDELSNCVDQDEAYIYELEKYDFNIQTASGWSRMYYRKLMAFNPNANGYHSGLIVPFVDGQTIANANSMITVRAMQSNIATANKSFLASFDWLYSIPLARMQAQWGDPDMPTGTDARFVLTLSGAESCSEGDVLQVGNVAFEIDDDVSSDTEFPVRDMYAVYPVTQLTYPTAGQGITNLTTSTPFTATFSSDTIDDSKKTGVYLTENGWHYWWYGNSMTEITVMSR